MLGLISLNLNPELNQLMFFRPLTEINKLHLINYNLPPATFVFLAHVSDAVCIVKYMITVLFVSELNKSGNFPT